MALLGGSRGTCPRVKTFFRQNFNEKIAISHLGQRCFYFGTKYLENFLTQLNIFEKKMSVEGKIYITLQYLFLNFQCAIKHKQIILIGNCNNMNVNQLLT